MDKWTKGPWKANRTSTQVTVDSEHFCIADCGTGDGAMENARLIAAAPELLEVLRGILEAEEGMGETDRPHMIKARAAIKKATS